MRPVNPQFGWADKYRENGYRDDVPGEAATTAPWTSQPWSAFRDAAADEQTWLIPGLLPEGVLVFVAAPPKKGKTWLALGLSLSIATGRPLFGEYDIPEPRSVLYVALEGSRSGIRARIGALARGLRVDPDGDEFDRLHLLYRPRPFDLADATSPGWLQQAANDVDAALVVIDVLRAAARFRENEAGDFARIRDAFDPLLDAGRSVALLHHFGKLNDTQQQRSPGERMAGTGAMYGALDVGFLITKSESGARRMRVEVEARDFATPEAIGVVVSGTGSGTHGGFTYLDTATLTIDATAAEDRDLASEIEQLLGDGTWRTVKKIAAKDVGIGANVDDVREALVASPERFVLVEATRVGRHATAKPWGTLAMLQTLENAEKVTRASESPESPLSDERAELQMEQVTPPIGESVESPASLQRAGGVESPEPPESPADEWLAPDGRWRSLVDEPPAFDVEVVATRERQATA